MSSASPAGGDVHLGKPQVAPGVDQEPAQPDPERSPLTVGQRVLEVLPGTATWIIILALIMTPILVYPTLVVAAIIVVDLYWLVRSIIVVRGILRTHRRIRYEVGEDWLRRCDELPEEAWTDADGVRFDPGQIYHASLIPTYTERYEVLKATVQALADADYPADRKLVAVITRTTDIQGIENVQRLQREHEGDFHRFWHILDPLLPGIVVGKSAAMAYGGPDLFQRIEDEGLDPRHVIVTDLDSDFRVHPRYMSRVTWDYVQDRERDYRLYQPVPMFHNNIWRVPAAVHVLASAATQWQMFLHTRPRAAGDLRQLLDVLAAGP